MAYCRIFFDFQLRFATRLATKFGPSLDDSHFHYTTFSKTLDGGIWASILQVCIKRRRRLPGLITIIALTVRLIQVADIHGLQAGPRMVDSGYLVRY